ncbi:DeoR/GlpR family DNA-binding transcription regulator [Aliiroseovarius crassostreae]|uniref:DeoR/GlpR family DNA-binding transcription regulator n=1 Tax=Aliiroseovarius crassostreae TaxID=154981 RepID=A0A9Q9LYY3_9RHOB|nr:DeoR/GlpR family DNA-binding transcription regulator [Aliiroseovarius crassostreae]UWP95059.1 DeoR/GlpR family DNA-binding transcription regulator [Aliiroseovarius crassostreae]
MSLSFRQTDILEIAKTDGRVTVEGLAARFDVTVQTIRRDLSELADAGKLERVHGGAVLSSGVSNIGYADRRGLHETAKADIARTCAEAIPDGASVFLNIGTTTEAVAQELLSHRDLLVVTNNLNVAQILAANPQCEIIVAGGVLRRTDAGLVGNLTIAAIEQFKFDYTVTSCSALDTEGDMMDFDLQEVNVSRVILSKARRSFLVADHSKFHRSAPARIASLQEIDTFFTDQPVTEQLSARCADWHTEIRVCEA